MEYLVYVTVFSAGFVLGWVILPFFVSTKSSSQTPVEQHYKLLLECNNSILLECRNSVKESVSSIRGMIQEDRIQRIKDCEKQMIQLASLSGVQEQLAHHIRKIEDLAVDELTRLNAENMELKSTQLRLRNQLELAGSMLPRQRQPNDRQDKNDSPISSRKNCEGGIR